jgi:hypothetical protein
LLIVFSVQFATEVTSCAAPRTVMQFLGLPLTLGRGEALTSPDAAADKLTGSLQPSAAALPE